MCNYYNGIVLYFVGRPAANLHSHTPPVHSVVVLVTVVTLPLHYCCLAVALSSPIRCPIVALLLPIRLPAARGCEHVIVDFLFQCCPCFVLYPSGEVSKRGRGGRGSGRVYPCPPRKP